MNARELATTLAALRCYQEMASGVSPIEAMVKVSGIATDDGQLEELCATEIGALCDKLNSSSSKHGVDEAHDKLSKLIEDCDAGNDDIRNAAIDLCDALKSQRSGREP